MNNGTQKKYKELSFIDDFIFCKILTTNPKLCKDLLELILKIKIKKIEISESQKTINQTYDGKGVRFDVYVEDSKGTIYDIEMQTTSQKDLGKRTRYYQGMIDLNLIEKGIKYGKLKKTYIIFICMDVPFANNLPIYTFKNICVEDKRICLNDEAIKVIINANGDRTKATPELCDFLDYLQNQKTNSTFTRNIQEAVNKAINKKEWEVEYMTMMMKIQEAQEDAEISRLIKCYKKFNASKEQILEDLQKEFGLELEEAEQKLSEYND